MRESNGNRQGGADRGAWGSKFGFILAAAGSAVGLGNIWKFPYITGENGGGIFVLIYLVCIALVGLPIMVAEIMIGRAARKQPVVAFETLQGKSTPWTSVGWLGVLAGFLMLSFYIVVAGWAVDYTLKSVVRFTDPVYETAELQALQYKSTQPIGTLGAAEKEALLQQVRAEHGPINGAETPSESAPDTLRMAIVRDLAHKAARDRLSQLASQIPNFVRKDHERYRKAMTLIRAEHDATEVPKLREALLSDATFRAHVERVEANRRERLKVLEGELERQGTKVALWPQNRVLETAETMKRREIIFAEVNRRFGGLAGDGYLSTFWAAVVIFASALMVSAGISGGIERACRLLMPLLVILILVMVGYGATQSGFRAAFDFVFKPDPSRLKASGALEALGHAFFTLSLGMGALITYGSYLKGKDNILGQSLAIAGLDTLIALLACLMIFPIVFSYGGEPEQGPGLVFKSMPLAFAEMGAGGMVISILFFGLLVFAALTSAISLLEVVASALIDRLGWNRRRATWTVALATLLVGVPSAFSAGESRIFTSWEAGYGKSFFDTVDHLVSNWMLPLGGLLVALYTGWILPRRVRQAELERVAPALVTGWLFLLRVIAPLLVLVVLAQKVGFFDIDELVELFRG